MRQLIVPSVILAGLCQFGCGDEDDDGGTPDFQEDRVAGETGTMGGHLVSTFATLDDDGDVTEVGIVLPLAAIRDVTNAEEVIARFPSESVDQTGIDHLQLGFLPQGHAQPFWAVAHFDIHFQRISIATREAIDCSAEPVPAADRLPEGYIIPSTALEPGGTCVPMMGVHAFDPNSPEVVGEDPFDETMIIGYHAGELSFVEPMITRQQFETKETFAHAVRAPERIAGKARYPATFSTTYLEESDSYELVISDFRDIEGVSPSP